MFYVYFLDIFVNDCSFCLPIILVLVELFGPHTLSLQQHFICAIDCNNQTQSSQTTPNLWQWSWWCLSTSLKNSQCLSASANTLAIVVLREWHIIRSCNELSEKIVCVQDLHWCKQNEHQQSSREANHLEKQLKQQLDNKLLTEWFAPEDWLPNWWNCCLCKNNSNWTYTNVRNWMGKKERLISKHTFAHFLLSCGYCSKLAFKFAYKFGF